jgi:hypothetical protein
VWFARSDHVRAVQVFGLSPDVAEHGVEDRLAQVRQRGELVEASRDGAAKPRSLATSWKDCWSRQRSAKRGLISGLRLSLARIQ